MSELMLCHCMSLSILSIHVDSFVCGRLEHTDVWLIHVTIICLLECYCILLFHDDSRTNCAMCFAEHAPLNPERNFVKHPDFSALYRIYRRPRVFPPLLSPLLAAFFSAANFLSCFRVKREKVTSYWKDWASHSSIAAVSSSCRLISPRSQDRTVWSRDPVQSSGHVVQVLTTPAPWPQYSEIIFPENGSQMRINLSSAKLMSQSWQMLRETT